MSEFFSNSTLENNPYSEFCEIYFLTKDEIYGVIPFFFYPEDSIKNNEEKLHLINIHYIWYMDIKEQSVIDYIDFGYKDEIYFARKFQTLSKRKKSLEKTEYSNVETIVIILAMPTDISSLGGDLLIKLNKNVIRFFENKLYQIIESEIVKSEIIKTPAIKEKIRIGEDLKKHLRILIANTCKEYFSTVLKEIDQNSIRFRNAISFFTQKGFMIDSGNVSNKNSIFSFNNSFKSKVKPEETQLLKSPFIISNIQIADNNYEIEIIIQNKSEKEINNISIKISHLKEFYEKEIIDQKIDYWAPSEQLMFIVPIIPIINEYFLIISKNNKKLFSKKIEVNLLINKSRNQ